MNFSDVNLTVHFANSAYIIIVPAVLMVIDIIVGILNAWKSKTIKSSKLRDGIVHKFDELIIIIVALFLQFTLGLPREIPVFSATYIIIMELISILENLSKSGVKVPEWVTERLANALEDANKEKE
jgi:toxin secretion/phage lysis holin